jgi:hypothetical protein
VGEYQIPVATISQQVIKDNANVGPFYLTNYGPDVVYADSAFQVFSGGTAGGTLINVGASISWRQGESLFLISPTTATLSISSSAENIFDPAGIAQQISGIGVPAIDAPVTILNTTQSVGAGVVPTSSGILNMSKYQSFAGQFNDTNATGQLTVRTITLTWFADAAGAFTIAIDKFDIACFNGIANIIRRVKGAYLQVSATAATTTTTSTVIWRMVASLRDQPDKTVLRSGKNNTAGYVRSDSDVFKGKVVLFGTQANGQVTEYVDIQTGPLSMYWRTTSSPTTVLAWDFLDFAGNSIWGYAMPANNAPVGGEFELTIPPIPFSIQITNLNAGAMNFTLGFISHPT